MLDGIIDVREYDVPFVMRAAIDNDIFVGLWYSVSCIEGNVTIKSQKELTASLGRAEPRILAFDIECTRPTAPVSFPLVVGFHRLMVSFHQVQRSR